MRVTIQSVFRNFVIPTLKYLALGIFTLYLLIWLASPIAVRTLANTTLEEMGVQLAASSSIRYNPFLTRITIDDLALEKNGVVEFELQSATIEVDLYRLLFNKLYVKTLTIGDVRLPIVQLSDVMKVAGFDIPSADKEAIEEKESEPAPESPETAKTPSQYTLVSPDISLKNIDITYTYQDTEYPISIDTLTIKNINATANEQKLSLLLVVKVAEGKITLQSDIAFTNESGKVDSTLDVSRIELATLQKELESVVTEISGKTSLSSTFSITIAPSQVNIIATDTTFTLEELTVEKDNFNVALQKHVMHFDKVHTALLDNEPQFLELTSVVQLENLHVQDTNQPSVLLSLGKLDTTPITLDSPQGIKPENIAISIANISAFDMVNSLVQDNDKNLPALSKIKNLTIDGLQYRHNDVAINNITIDSIENHIIIGENKEILTLSTITEAAEPAEENTTEKEESTTEGPQNETPSTKITLGEFSIKGDNQVYFTDRSVSPAYDRVFHIDTLSIREINSESSALSPFELVGRSNEYAKINLHGAFNPFSEKVNLNIAGDLNEVSLPTVSSYIKDSLGFELKSGQLDSQLDVQVKDSELDGKIKLHLRGMDMSSADASDSTSLKNQTVIPLNVALGMLKDKRGNIKLSLPMNGSVDDPSFGLSSFLVIISKKAAMSQAKSYLMNTFVPYASVVSVAMSAGEFALKLRFEDLLFEPTMTEIGEKQTQYTKEFVTLMKDKPKTQVKVCGFATVEEAGYAAGTKISDPVARDALTALAKQRAENFKKYAVTEGGIEAARILLCNPAISVKKDAKPRIEISI